MVRPEYSFSDLQRALTQRAGSGLILLSEHAAKGIQGPRRFRMVRAQDTLLNPQGPFQKGARSVVLTLLSEHPGQNAQAARGVRVVRTQDPFSDLPQTLATRLGSPEVTLVMK